MLNANDRLHYMAKARRVETLRQMAGWHGKAWRNKQKLKAPLDHRVWCVVRLSFPRLGRRDALNFSDLVKPLVDGLVDAGVLADDSDTHLVGPDIRISGRGCREPFACHVELELHDATDSAVS